MFLDALINPDKPNIAIDIGSKFIKIVSLKKLGTKIQLNDFSIIELPENIENFITTEKKDQTEEFKDKLAVMVKDAISKSQAKGKNVILGVNTRYLVPRIVPVMGEPESNEFKAAVDAAIKDQFANYQKDSIKTAFEILSTGNSENPNQVLISAARVEAINFFQEIISKAGYKLTAIDGVPFALYNIFEYINEMDDSIKKLPTEKRNFLLIDIGYNNLNIIGVKGGNPAYFKGSFNFNDRLIVETMKSNEGLSEKDAYNKKYELFEKSINETTKAQIKDEVLRKYYSGYFANQIGGLIKEIEQVLGDMELSKENLYKISFSGGGAFFPFLFDFIYSKIKTEEESPLKVEMIMPFYKMVEREGEMIKKFGSYKSSLFASATGLALRTI